MTSPPDLEEIETRLVLEAIYLRYGYDLRGYAMTTLRRRLEHVRVQAGLPDLATLQRRVLVEPAFFNEVLEQLTVHVSELFRDPPFYRAFRARVVPVLRTYPVLRIWHSGCATGEEAYASAILLQEEGLYDRAQLYATDMSARALEQAKEAVYGADRIARYEANYVAAGGTARFDDYYTAAYDRMAMRGALKRNILFFQHNLVTDHVFGEMQVVFCRNVLIYFDAALRTRVLERLRDSLCPAGFLCVGAAEHLLPADMRLGFERFDDLQGIYRRAA